MQAKKNPLGICPLTPAVVSKIGVDDFECVTEGGRITFSVFCEDEGDEVYVSSLTVFITDRRRGVAKILLQEVVNFAVEKDIKSVFGVLSSSELDKEMLRKIYFNCGFFVDEDLLTFSREISTE